MQDPKFKEFVYKDAKTIV
jgi:hypothetical protein